MAGRGSEKYEIRTFLANWHDHKISWWIGLQTCGKPVNPHMPRHFYATEMIKRGVNPEIVRRQMRHKNVSTTLRIYTQIKLEELEKSLSTKPSEKSTKIKQKSIKTLREVK